MSALFVVVDGGGGAPPGYVPDATSLSETVARVLVVDARRAPRTARLLLDSPRRPIPCCFLARGRALFDVGASKTEIDRAAAAADGLALDRFPEAFSDRQAAKAAVTCLKRRRLACAALNVATCLCDASLAEIAFWIDGPPPPVCRRAFGFLPATSKGGAPKPITLASRLRSWR